MLQEFSAATRVAGSSQWGLPRPGPGRRHSRPWGGERRCFSVGARVGVSERGVPAGLARKCAGAPGGQAACACAIAIATGGVYLRCPVLPPRTVLHVAS